MEKTKLLFLKHRFNRLNVNFLVILFLFPSISWSVEIFFSPGQDCENKIIAAINDSKQEVVAAVYAINNAHIISALKAAHVRGVKIRILTDRTQASSRSSLVMELIKAGLDVRVHSKHKIEHNKFGVFDKKIAINGSYNWTAPASESNSENCAVMPEPNAVMAYKKRFEILWNMNSAAKSKAAITKIETNQAQRSAAGK